ncbi:MAG: hypothetical protein ACK5MB_12365, partial [Phycisphaerales bacterium]
MDLHHGEDARLLALLGGRLFIALALGPRGGVGGIGGGASGTRGLGLRRRCWCLPTGRGAGSMTSAPSLSQPISRRPNASSGFSIISLCRSLQR